LKILLLEDDKILHDSIKIYFELENITVISAYNSDDVYKISYEEKFDLYLFDINVDGDNGFEILKYLREADDYTPTIFITALNDIDSFTKGFECGADDYIKKPFNIEELVIKIRSKYIIDKTIVYKNIVYNPKTKTITIENNLIYLSNTLMNIFHELIINKNKIVIYDILLEYIDKESKNGLKTIISQLKNKLNIEIKNIRGVGYTLETV